MLTFVAIGGCSTRSPAGPSPPQASGRVHLLGQLVEGGAECQRLRTFDQQHYTLTGDLRGFRSGDTVEITGTIPAASHCMQDTPVQVETISAYRTP